jgi:hypothetical protein
MVETGRFLLDVLAQLGGGRGEALNTLAPHLLGMILWGSLCVYEAISQRRNRRDGNLLLLISFMASFI